MAVLRRLLLAAALLRAAALYKERHQPSEASVVDDEAEDFFEAGFEDPRPKRVHLVKKQKDPEQKRRELELKHKEQKRRRDLERRHKDPAYRARLTKSKKRIEHDGAMRVQVRAENEAKRKAEAEAQAAPQAEMPKMKVSQIVPLVVMFGLNKWDLDAMGYRRHVEAAFAVAQVVCLALLFVVHRRILALEDDKDSPKIKVPEVKQLGQVVTQATEQTVKEHDKAKFHEQAKQAIMGAVILGGVYFKWQYLMPLVLQIFMTPMQLAESPLFELHILGKDVKRPFPVPSPFGFPSMPEAPAAPVADAPDKADAKGEVKDAGKADSKKDK